MADEIYTDEQRMRIEGQKQFEEEQHKKNIEQLNTFVSVAEQNIKRQKFYKDPVTNSCIFLEKFLITIDFAKGYLSGSYRDIPDELSIRINNLFNDINKNVELLIDMIQQPCYSPNHPYGKALMLAAENDFKKNESS